MICNICKKEAETTHKFYISTQSFYICTECITAVPKCFVCEGNREVTVSGFKLTCTACKGTGVQLDSTYMQEFIHSIDKHIWHRDMPFIQAEFAQK